MGSNGKLKSFLLFNTKPKRRAARARGVMRHKYRRHFPTCLESITGLLLDYALGCCTLFGRPTTQATHPRLPHRPLYQTTNKLLTTILRRTIDDAFIRMWHFFDRQALSINDRSRTRTTERIQFINQHACWRGWGEHWASDKLNWWEEEWAGGRLEKVGFTALTYSFSSSVDPTGQLPCQRPANGSQLLSCWNA